MTYVPTLPLGDAPHGDPDPHAGPAPTIAATGATPAVRAIDYRCGATACSGWVASRHARTSLVLVTEGTFCYADHGYTRLVEPGALVVGLEGDRYACAHDYGGGDRAWVFQFAPGALEDALEPALKAGRVLAPDPRLAAWAARAGRATDAETLEMAAFGLAGAALAAHAEAPPSLRAGDRDRAHAAARHLDRHHAVAVSLAELAEEVGLSPFHLTRVFRQELGLTPHQYLLRARLRHAAALLADTRMPVTEVAYAVGFGDLSNFHRTFKRHMGETPAAFRRA